MIRFIILVWRNGGLDDLKQTVGHKKVTPALGLALIAGLLLILVLLNYVVLDYVAALLGNTAAAICFWVVGGLIALWMLRTFVVVYTYELGDNVLRLCRKYGKRERFIEDIYLTRITFVGTSEEAKRRNPKAAVVKAIHSAVKTEPTAVVFDTSENTKIAVLQADTALRAKLVEIVRENKR